MDPKTKAPFAKRLINIKNADAILKGKKSVEDLGVKVIDAYTLKIELSKEDPTFLETLTTSIAMPCNEEFFKNTSGKYGLDKKNTLSNGAYMLSGWKPEKNYISFKKSKKFIYIKKSLSITR